MVQNMYDFMSCYEACWKQTNLTQTIIDKQDMDGIDILNGLRQIDGNMTCFFPLNLIPLKMNVIWMKSFCLQAKLTEVDNILRNAFQRW